MSRSEGRLGRYIIKNVSDRNVAAVADSVRRNLVSLEDVLQALMEGYREVRHNPPDRPETGMIVYADGSDWDPGSGEGSYEYRSNNTWHKL